MIQPLVAHIEKFSPINADQINLLESFFEHKICRKRDLLLTEGHRCYEKFFIVKGCLHLYYLRQNGTEQTIDFALENWWITDYKAFITQSKATLNIDCLENTEVLCLSLSDKAKLCAESHSMEHFFRIKTTAGYIAMQQRVLSFLSHDAGTRYKQLFALYPTLFQRLPKTLIASFLGVSRETLSRISVR